jgi:hypothetical protein
MKLYFICPKQLVIDGTHEDGTPHKDRFVEFHWIDTSDGKILLAARFSNEHAHEVWSTTEGVESLPHPLSGDSIDDKHHQHLKDVIGTDPKDNVFHVAAKAAKKHPCMKLTVL